MSRERFLRGTGLVALGVGGLALVAPEVLLAEVKHASYTDAGVVMARTVGVLLGSVGVLNLLVCEHEDSATMRSVLWANLVLQVSIAPIDVVAFAQGTFRTWGSFLPNTILHVVLAAGFVWHLRRPMSSQVGVRT